MGVSPWEPPFSASSGSLLWRELGGQEVEARPWVHTQAGTFWATWSQRVVAGRGHSCGFSQDPANWVGLLLSPLPCDWRVCSSLDTQLVIPSKYLFTQRLQPCSPTIIRPQRAKRGCRHPPSASRMGYLFFWDVNSDHCSSPVRTTSARPHDLLLPTPLHHRTSLLRGAGDARQGCLSSLNYTRLTLN